jgi:hypothetical protein
LPFSHHRGATEAWTNQSINQSLPIALFATTRAPTARMKAGIKTPSCKVEIDNGVFQAGDFSKEVNF